MISARWQNFRGSSSVRGSLAIVIILLSFAPSLLAQDPNERENESKDDPRARALYLERKRSGGAPVPPGARQQALRDVDTMLEREGKAYWQSVSQSSTTSTSVSESTAAARESSTAGSPLPISTSQWTPIGPQATNPNPSSTGGGAHFAGRVTALAVDPTKANIVYLGGAQGGVWKTIDGGTNWTPLTDKQASLAVGSIVIDPTNAQIIYVGTGEENFGADSYYGAGVLKSTDGGASWAQLGQTTFAPTTPECTNSRLSCGGAKIGAIAIQPGTGGASAHLLAAVQRGFSNSGGLYWSTDAGATWNAVSGANAATVDSVVFANTTTAFVGIHRSGVFICTGFSTTPNCTVSNGTGANLITTANTDRVSLAADSAGVLYAALADANTSNLSGLYKSTDLGSNWTNLNAPNFCSGQCFYDMLVAVNPANAQNVWIGGSGFPNSNFIYHSINAGAAWILDTPASPNIHADQHAAAFSADGSKMYIGNDGGVYSTTGIGNGAVAWTELNNTLNITQFYGYFSIHPANSQLTYGGTQDNGTQRFSGALAWDEVTCGDGASAVIDVNTPSTVFANCQDIDVRRSSTGNPGSFGGSNTAGTNISTSDRVAFIPPMVGDTANPMKLYFGTCRLWQATSNNNSAISWAAITGDLTAGGGAGTCDQSVIGHEITNIGISQDNGTAYVVTSEGIVSRVTNLSTTHDVTTITPTTAAGFPGNSPRINAVAVVDANTAYIAVAGFTSTAHVFKTVDGVNWTNITNNLPNTPANDIVVDPDLSGTLYLATDVGVFKSANNGASWSTLNTGLPNVAVFGLKLHHPSRTLRAATHGRGMWDLNVPACGTGACVAVSPGGLNFGTQPVGTLSAPQSITVTNIGTQPLVVTNISSGGEYSQTNNCTSVPVNGTCTIMVTFYPRSGSAPIGGITLISNGGSPHVALSGIGTVIQPNDDFANGAVITSGSYTNSMNTLTATSEASDPTPPVACVNSFFPADPLGWDPSSGFNHHAVWFSYTPATSGTVNLDTLTSDYDTVLSVWTGTPGSFTNVACNDDAPGQSSAPSQISNMPVTAGTTYRILASGFYAASAGNLAFHFSGPPPVIGFSAAGLSFTGLPGHSGAPQSLTLTNNTAGTINISSVSVSGDYSLAHTCPLTLGSGGSCTISVTFNPAATGQRIGILSITDNAAGSPQNLPVNGFGFDFGLGFVRSTRNGSVGNGQSTSQGNRPSRSVRSSSANIVVVAGQKQTFNVELASSGISNEMVNLECVGAPPGATCSVEPSQVLLSGKAIPIEVILDTSGSTSHAASGAARAKRLAVNPIFAGGNYELQVNARVGEVFQSLTINLEMDDKGVDKKRSSRLSNRIQ
jgi:hypothetical protein